MTNNIVAYLQGVYYTDTHYNVFSFIAYFKEVNDIMNLIAYFKEFPSTNCQRNSQHYFEHDKSLIKTHLFSDENTAPKIHIYIQDTSTNKEIHTHIELLLFRILGKLQSSQH